MSAINPANTAPTAPTESINRNTNPKVVASRFPEKSTAKAKTPDRIATKIPILKARLNDTQLTPIGSPARMAQIAPKIDPETNILFRPIRSEILPTIGWPIAPINMPVANTVPAFPGLTPQDFWRNNGVIVVNAITAML